MKQLADTDSHGKAASTIATDKNTNSNMHTN